MVRECRGIRGWKYWLVLFALATRLRESLGAPSANRRKGSLRSESSSSQQQQQAGSRSSSIGRELLGALYTKTFAPRQPALDLHLSLSISALSDDKKSNFSPAKLTFDFKRLHTLAAVNKQDVESREAKTPPRQKPNSNIQGKNASAIETFCHWPHTLSRR